MPELISLLTPHFDYSQPVVKQEVKQESLSRGGGATKKEAKKEQQPGVKMELKQERSQAGKREQHVKSETSSKQLKREPALAATMSEDDVLSEAAVRICSFDHTSAVIECTRFQ